MKNHPTFMKGDNKRRLKFDAAALDDFDFTIDFDEDGEVFIDLPDEAEDDVYLSDRSDEDVGTSSTPPAPQQFLKVSGINQKFKKW